MDSSSPSSITKEQFNAFHSFDRALFTRIVMCLRGDITQSFQVMSFLIYIERIYIRTNNLISDLVPSSDYSINKIVDEVIICLRCLSCEHFPTFLATLGNINASYIVWTRSTTGDKLTLGVIHQKRREILLEMTQILNTVCYPAFEDICVHIEMHKERNMTTFFQSMCGGQETRNRVAAGTSNVHEGQHVWADDRTVFLKFSKGYPISEAEVHAYFTGRFGDIVEAINMGGVGRNNQATYASMVLRSAEYIPAILNDEQCRTNLLYYPNQN